MPPQPLARSALALDVGRKRIGLAGCDPLGITVTPLMALARGKFPEDLERLDPARFPAPTGAPATWTRAQQIHHLYHHPDHLIPGPPGHYPAHVHIDLLPRAQGRGLGKKMMGMILGELRRRGLPGVHLGVGADNSRAQAFYRKLGFTELCRVGGTDGCMYMGLRLDASPASRAERRVR